MAEPPTEAPSHGDGGHHRGGARSPYFGGRGGHHRGGAAGRNYAGPRREVEPRQREIQEAPNTVFVHTSDRVAVPALLKHIDELMGPGAVLQHYFKDKQNFGFVQFSSPENVEKALQIVNRTAVDSSKITIERSRAPPKRAQPVPATSAAAPAENGQSAPAAAGAPTNGEHPEGVDGATSGAAAPPQEIEKTNSIVVKNLPFQLKQEEFQEILNTFDVKPLHLKYHLDNGQFRGIAFIKYRSVEDSTAMFDKFQSFEIGGRRIRCEYKRKLEHADTDLDLDAEDAKALWEQLNRFKESPQTELAFPSTLTSLQRKQIHYFADRLALVHYSQGEGEGRFIMVAKRRERQPQGSNTVGLQPTDDKSWRVRNQEEKKKAAAEPTLRIQPVRQPKGPESGKGFSDEYRAARKVLPPAQPAPVPAAGTTSPSAKLLSAAAPAFQPKASPPVPAANKQPQ